MNPLADREALLSAKEKAALVGVPAGNRLSPATAAQFYALYLQGYSAEDIAKQNPNFGGLALGLIVRARVEFDWDAEREKYTRNLMVSAAHALEKSTLEAIQFTSDGITVFHRLVGDRFRRYLQTGDANTLGDLKDMSFKTYRELVGLLQSLTGQDPKAQQTTVNVTAPAPAATSVDSMPVLPANAPVPAATAAALLELLNTKEKV